MTRLSFEQLKTYQEKGYVILPALFSMEEIQEAREECQRLLSLDLVHHNNVRTPFRKNSGNTPERIDPVTDISPLFEKLVQDHRIMDAVKSIFQGNAELFKDKVIFKQPGTDGYPMHQDNAWWQMCPGKDVLSLLVTIDSANKENGCLEFFPGYHHEMLTPAENMRSNFTPRELAMIDMSKGEFIELEPGDVVIFHSLAPHQSGTNHSQESRRLLYLTFSNAKHGDLRSEFNKVYRSFEKVRDAEPGKEKFYR